MAKNKNRTTEDVEEEVTEEEGEGEEAKKDEPSNTKEKKSKVVAVSILKGERFIREYSLDVHGEDFEKLAKEFCSKFVKEDLTIVDSSSINELTVKYREKLDAELPLDKQSADSPFVDKQRVFNDKEEALQFNVIKKGSIVVKKQKKVQE